MTNHLEDQIERDLQLIAGESGTEEMLKMCFERRPVGLFGTGADTPVTLQRLQELRLVDGNGQVYPPVAAALRKRVFGS